jgi:hypothetical protein
VDLIVEDPGRPQGRLFFNNYLTFKNFSGPIFVPSKNRMIKKAVSGILVFIVLLTTTGLTAHYHYCHNTLISYSFLHTPKPCCEHSDGCCQNKTVTCQYRADYTVVADHFDFSLLVLEPVRFTELVLPVVPDAPAPVIVPDESPPRELTVKLAILQQYLI